MLGKHPRIVEIQILDTDLIKDVLLLVKYLPPHTRFLSIGFGLEISNSSKLNSFLVSGQGSLSDMFSVSLE